jgi:O-antigen/teichoic acid export membrane protein
MGVRVPEFVNQRREVDPNAPVRAVPEADAARRIVGNGTMNLVAQGLNAVFNVVVVVLLARGTDKGALGAFYTVFAFIMVVQVVLEMGLSTVLTLRLVQAPERWGATLAEAKGLLALVTLGSLMTLLGIGAAWSALVGDPALLGRFALAGLACAAIQVERFTAAVFRASERFAPENLGRVVQGGVFAALVLALVVGRRAGVGGVLAALAASHLVVAVGLAAGLRRSLRGIGWGLSRSALRDWLAQSVPLGLGDMVRGLTWQLDTVLLGLLQSAAVVGIYSVAYRPLGPLNWVPRAVLAAAFPAFARSAASDPEALNRAGSNSIRLLGLVGLPIAVVICTCAEPLIRLLAGPDYLEAVAPLRVLIWITVLSFLSTQFRFLFAAAGRQQTFARLAGVVLVLEAGLEAVLIPRWSYYGACIGSLVGELVFTVVGLALCRSLGINGIAWKTLRGAVLAAAAMALPLWLARGIGLPLLVAVIALATGTYVVVCLLLDALRWHELKYLIGAFASGRGLVVRPRRAD